MGSQKVAGKIHAVKFGHNYIMDLPVLKRSQIGRKYTSCNHTVVCELTAYIVVL